MTRVNDIDQEHLRQQIVAAVYGQDQTAADRAAFVCGLHGWTTFFEETVTRAIASASHEVQQFWLGECACHRDTPHERIALGRPVTLQPELEELNRQYPEVELPPIYPGSAVVPCANCATPTYQGPRLQEAIAANAGLIFMCYLCAMTTVAGQTEPGGRVMLLTDMGNPYRRSGAHHDG